MGKIAILLLNVAIAVCAWNQHDNLAPIKGTGQEKVIES